MPRALFKSINLIGDCLYAGLAMQEWARQNPLWSIDLWTIKNHATSLYGGMGIPFNEILYEAPVDRIESYGRFIELGAGNAGVIANEKKCHIADAFAEICGVTLDVPTIQTPWGNFKAHCPIYTPEVEPVEEELKNLVLISPISLSCSSQKRDATGQFPPPNKMIPWRKWKPMLRYLRTLGSPIRMLGAKEDRADELELTEDEYLTGVPINKLALIMKHAKLLVTIDNGMGHLAASQHIPYVLFYPMCLSMNFIVPWGSPRLMIIQMEPSRVESAELLWALKGTVDKLGITTGGK